MALARRRFNIFLALVLKIVPRPQRAPLFRPPALPHRYAPDELPSLARATAPFNLNSPINVPDPLAGVVGVVFWMFCCRTTLSTVFG